ncbi:YveK family protein [Ligilactobacillus cholophilus]|uniref:YveK family protein n=1 Tax=Ligilactobacillus cholophilus TaxID=3050131 RepID=UPI0025B24BE5|nr:Wzz/FepE/Etk N-terminal domain-containing protein [Ligilactobacillus cholophilus]
MNDIQSQEKSSKFSDIGEILGILRKRKGIIIWTTIICTVIALFTSVFVISPKYSSSTNILVNQKTSNNANDPNNVNQGQMQAAVQMINTYKDIITSPAILDEVADKIQNDGYTDSASAIKGMISLSNEQNSQVFTVTVKCDNPNKAAVIANTTAKVFKKKIKTIMSVNNVSILSHAQVNPNPISPNVLLNTLISIVIGLVLGIVLAFILNGLDRTVTDESFITDELGLNDLGIISEIPASKVKKLLSHSRGLGRTESRNRRV